jgi:pSer/pThr/pTyr-binding forkhead associated (FHA) protein
MASSDPLELALASDRAIFVAACPDPFLFRAAGLRGLRSVMRRTQEAPPLKNREDITDVIQLPEARTSSKPTPRPPARALVLPVRNVQREFPGMITVGRTPNNDVVVEDPQVSKFHAFFRAVDGGLELSDAGSRNGTWIEGARLVPKASWTSTSVTPGRSIHSGAQIRFGDFELIFLDAGALWDHLHRY